MPENKGFEKGKGTKRKIEDAAMELFAEYGYKGTSVRKIAAKVGIRESALYNHFKNKEAIFIAITERAFNTPFSQDMSAESIQASAKKGKAFLQKYVTEFKLMSFDRNSEKLFRFLMIELMQNPLLREGFEKRFRDINVKFLSSVFFAMMQEGLIRSDDPMVMADAFMGQLFYIRLNISLLKADSRSTAPYSTAFEKALDFFWRGIALEH